MTTEERDKEIEEKQLFLWGLPHWADETRIVFGSIYSNQIIALHGAGAITKGK